MNESIIVYTSFALVSAIIGSLVTGYCMGWLIKQYQSARELKRLQWEVDFKEALNIEQKEALGNAYVNLEDLNQQVHNELKKDRMITDLLLKRRTQRALLNDKKSAIEKSNVKAVQAHKQIVDYHQRLTRSSVRLNSLLQENLNLKGALAAASKATVQLKPITVSDLHRGTAAAVSKKRVDSLGESKTPVSAEDFSTNSTTSTVASIAVAGVNNTKNTDKQAVHKADKLAEIQSSKRTSALGSKVGIQRTNIAAKTAANKPNLKSDTKPRKDDLKQIKGIGPAIEIALNSIGIVRLEQLAKLNKKEIKEVDQKLKKYTGRITRDNWVASAKKLNRKMAAA